MNPVVTANVLTVHPEVLYDNIIGEELQAVLRPLNFMQSVFICAKYNLRNSFVTFNTCLYNILGIASVLFLFSLNVFLLSDGFHFWGQGFILFLNWSKIFNFCFNYVGYILNVYTNIKESRNNIALVLRIEHVLRILELTRKDLKNLIVSNWGCVVFVVGIWLNSILFFYLIFNVDMFNLVLTWPGVHFDINMVYVYSIMKLLHKLVDLWIEDVKRSENMAQSENNINWEIKYDSYRNIFEGYTIVAQVFQRNIAFYTIFTTFQGLLHIAIILQLRFSMLYSDTFIDYSMLIIVTQVWLVKSIILEILLSVECERFYSAMRDVQHTCLSMMYSRMRSDTQTRVCKNISRLQRTTFKSINACSLFYIDAMLPLRLFSFITSYTIALLQFAFL